jgi:hypothetical protein
MQAVASITPPEPALAARPRLAQSDAGAAARQVGTAADPPQAGRALVLAGSRPGTGVGPVRSRPSAVFLAQLIATAQQAPQTRRRRRAEPDEASLSYAAVSAPAARMGRAICRSM